MAAKQLVSKQERRKALLPPFAPITPLTPLASLAQHDPQDSDPSV